MAEGDFGGGDGDLAGDEFFATAFAFVIKEDAVAGKEIVAFAVVYGGPEGATLATP